MIVFQILEYFSNSLQMIQNLIDDTFSRTLEFLGNTHSTPVLESDLPQGDRREGWGRGGAEGGGDIPEDLLRHVRPSPDEGERGRNSVSCKQWDKTR